MSIAYLILVLYGDAMISIPQANMKQCEANRVVVLSKSEKHAYKINQAHCIVGVK